MATNSRRGGRAAELTARRQERVVFDRLVEAVRAGESRVLVLRGEPGVGKTALLDYLAWRVSGCRVARAVGVQSEMELAFAGLHLLCASMLDHLDKIPVPQRDALRIAFGLSTGPPPDRFLVGLAVLSLLSEVAGERPLICVVDDEQWLDRASAQALGFAARRLAADPVGLVFAAREPSEELAGLPELVVEGLQEGDARALLDSALAGPLDERVRDQIVAETQGNPLALLELPRGLTPAELAGGFGLPGAAPLAGRIEESFGRQLEALPPEALRLVQLAAADPSGDPTLVWRAAGRLGIQLQAGAAAAEAGLAEFGVRVRFRHPLLRSAAYRSASAADRRAMHGALAEVTDPVADPDRRVWHRAQATSGPDEEVAAELEHSAGRAQARGGLAAAGAFLERSVLLTLDPARRAERTLAAAQANLRAGAFDKALDLLVTAEAGPLDEFASARVDLLRGQIAFTSGLGSDAPPLLLKAAKRLEPLNLELARETYLNAWMAALFAGRFAGAGDLLEVSRAARGLPPAQSPRPVDLALDGLTLLVTDGPTVAAPTLRQAARVFAGADVSVEEALRWGWLAQGAASAVWDDVRWRAILMRQVQIARDVGALDELPIDLGSLGTDAAWCGDTRIAADALARLAETTQAGETDFGLGIEARSRALLSDGEMAEGCYREAIARLGRTRLRPELARAHLLYGEWLRREGRRADAREQLRTAHEMLAAMGAEGFAERARRELMATGETVRKRTAQAADTLTAQEASIARLARDGRTNPEIGAQLFLSARTVEWHLRKVFTKLGISSRRELPGALASSS